MHDLLQLRAAAIGYMVQSKRVFTFGRILVTGASYLGLGLEACPLLVGDMFINPSNS